MIGSRILSFHMGNHRVPRNNIQFFYTMTLFLVVITCVHANAANRDSEIDGTVIAGSIDNKITISIANPSVKTPIESVKIDIAEKGRWITNIRIQEDKKGPIASKSTRHFTVLFDVSPDAQKNAVDKVTLRVSAKGALVDHPNQEITVKIEKATKEIPTPAVTTCVLKEEAKDFSIENALEHCALDIPEANEYDKIVVFFTPKRDLNESNPEEFRFRVKNPNGKVVKNGDFIRSEPGDEECPACLMFTRPGSPGRFAVKLDLWDTQRLHKDPKKRFYMPGTYIVETIGLGRTAGAGLFGQGQSGRKEEGEWQEEGRFQVKDGNIHFAGFVVEPVNQLSMPPTSSRWGGEANIERLDVDLEKGKVDVHVTASWQNTKRRSDGTQGPGDKLRKGRTELTMFFPKVISPGRVVQQYDRTGQFLIPLEPMAEINIDWKADGLLSSGDGNACYVPVFQKLAPILPPISRQVPSESWTGQTSMDQALDTPQAIMNKSWIPASNKKSVYRIGLCSRHEPFGSPSRTLPWHLHDPDTLWVFPVKFTLSPSSLSFDVEFYGYGVYRRTPGKYDGAQPDAPPWGRTDSRPAGEAGDKPDEVSRGEREDTPGEDPRERPAGEPRPDRDPEMPIDPNTLDPSDREVADYIGEWITAARPPENAVEGNNVRYSGKGNIIGTVVGGIIESRHETGEVDPVFLWTNRRSLDSVDHCTMKEFVVARLKNESISHCAGRYGAVKNLKGLRLADARAVVTGAGFEYSLVPGSPAKTPEEEGKVEKQEPGPEQYLKKGQAIRLTIHAPYVPKTVPLPDFIGKPLAEARKWIEQHELKTSLRPGSPASAGALSGAVEKQEPAAGTEVAKGSTVTLAIHSAYVDLRAVPDVHGLAQDAARSRMEVVGLVMDRRDAGRPAESRLANTVKKQDPAPGTSIAKGSAVVVWVYGQYTPSREERVAATDCSQYPGSRAYWDETVGGPRCECFDGLVWNLATSHCVTADVRANEICARDMPGTSARGRTAEGKINCVCPDGQFWNVSQRRCERQLTPQEICDRDVPGTTARGKTPEGKINCVCPDGQFWSASHRRCERQLSPREICEQHYPGSVPTGKDASGRVNCDCPQGYVWADNPRRCIKGDTDRRGWDRNQQCQHEITQIKQFMDMYRRDPRTASHLKGVAETMARQAAANGCDQGQINQALGSDTTGTGRQGEDIVPCHCIDEQGRPYAEAFGQECGTGGQAFREYNCR